MVVTAAKKTLLKAEEVKVATTETASEAKAAIVKKRVESSWGYARAHAYMTTTFGHFDREYSFIDKAGIAKSMAASLNGEMVGQSRESFIRIIRSICNLRVLHSLSNAGQEVPYKYRPDGGFGFFEKGVLRVAMPAIGLIIKGETKLPSFESILVDAFNDHHNVESKKKYTPKYTPEESGVKFTAAFNDLRSNRDNIRLLRVAVDNDDRLEVLKPLFAEELASPKEADVSIGALASSEELDLSQKAAS